jgi:5-methylthioadenosine/S-adenosylhomocysteine deaminase
MSPRSTTTSYGDGMTSTQAGRQTVPADLVITGCTVLVHDDRERIGFAEDAAIVVRDGVVESVTPASDVRDLPASSASARAAGWLCPA